MANPPGMDAWLKYADQVGKTPEERARLRANVYARYGVTPPARQGKKRGGLAGIYDRNKKLVSAAATAAGYYFGGPGGAAAARGAVQGFDRPGKSGVGFDVGRGAKGALEGFLAGKTFQVGSGLAKKAGTKLFGNKAAEEVAKDAAEDYTQGFVNAGRSPDEIAAMRPSAANTVVGVGTGVADTKTKSQLLSNLLKPEAIGGITSGVGQTLGGYMEREAELERVKLEREQREREEERANRLAELLMPMAASQSRLLAPQYGGYSQMG